MLIAMSAFELYIKRNLETARKHSQAALEIYRKLGDRRNIAWSIFWLNTALVPSMKKEDAYFNQAIALNDEAITLLRLEGDLAGVAQGLNNLGVYASIRGDNAQSKAAFQEALEIARQIHDELREYIQYGNLASLAMDEGNYERALELFEKCLRWANEHENSPQMLSAIASLTSLWNLRGQPERSARLVGVGEALFERLGVKLQTSEQPDYDATFALVRKQLGNAKLITLVAEGRSMRMEQAIAYALGDNEVE
jgi:tetratricopeptide (TPR) repeat protein